MATTSLAPYPGSKRAKKYNMLRTNELPRLCEPFMGGAATSIATRKRSTLGEINPWMRAIAHAPSRQHRRKFIESYNEAREFFLNGVDLDVVYYYNQKHIKQAQKLLKEKNPDLYFELGDRWNVLKETLWGDMDNAGLYAFCQRVAHGTVMRTSRSGFNVTYGITKIRTAVNFDPTKFCNDLRDWKPVIYSSWQTAIDCCPKPQETHLLLDPPYWVDGTRSKMTPCYPGHEIGTKGTHDPTYDLAIQPLQAGFDRRFPLIHLCNYYSDRLQNDVANLAFSYGYSVQRFELGECQALGNSNGRRKHGQRVDGRDRPVEVIYQFKPGQLDLF